MQSGIDRLNRSRRDKLDWAAKLGLGPLSGGPEAPRQVQPPRSFVSEEDEEKRKEELLAQARLRNAASRGSIETRAPAPPQEDEDVDASGFLAPKPQGKKSSATKSVLEMRMGNVSTESMTGGAYPMPGQYLVQQREEQERRRQEAAAAAAADADEDEEESDADTRNKKRRRKNDDDLSQSLSRSIDDDDDFTDKGKRRQRKDEKRKREEWRKQYKKEKDQVKKDEGMQRRKKRVAQLFDAGDSDLEDEDDNEAGLDEDDDSEFDEVLKKRSKKHDEKRKREEWRRQRKKAAQRSKRDGEDDGESSDSMKDLRKKKVEEHDGPASSTASKPWVLQKNGDLAATGGVQRKYVGQLSDAALNERLRAAEEASRGQKLLTEAEAIALLQGGGKRRR